MRTRTSLAASILVLVACQTAPEAERRGLARCVGAPPEDDAGWARA